MEYLEFIADRVSRTDNESHEHRHTTEHRADPLSQRIESEQGARTMRVVSKFGGTSLGTGDRVTRAADSIAAVVEQGHEIAVVASAMGSTTDELIDSITFEPNETDRAEIVSMGERTSVRMLKAALSTRDIDTIFLEPGDPEWPIITNKRGEVDIDESERRIKALTERLDGIVPIITGFLAQDHAGNVTTLGRGGSDMTAVMLGKYLDADEVVIVTDVEGVMTGDPRVVEGARNVGQITVDELRNLSFRGAEVVAPSALSYKTEDLTVRVVHYQHGDLFSGGTTIEGQFQNLIDLREKPLACITLAGRAVRNQRGVLASLSASLAEEGINIDAVASGMDSVTFYVDQELKERVEALLHDVVIEDDRLSSVTVDDDIAAVRVTGGELPNRPGVISEIVNPLAEERINIHDIITSATSVAIFVSQDDAEDTLETIQELFSD